MIKDVIIKKLEQFTDDRGWLFEVYRSDEINYRPEMSYVSQTNPGIMRGPHEHKEQSDYFIFLVGKFRLYLWDNREGAKNYRQLETLEVGEGNPCCVVVPPGVVHGYKCISETPGLVINLPDKLYRGKGKSEEVDEIRWEIIENSPFKVD